MATNEEKDALTESDTPLSRRSFIGIRPALVMRSFPPSMTSRPASSWLIFARSAACIFSVSYCFRYWSWFCNQSSFAIID